MASNTALTSGDTSSVPRSSSEHGGGIAHHNSTSPSTPANFATKQTSVEPGMSEKKDTITSPSRSTKSHKNEAILHDNTSPGTQLDKTNDVQIPHNKFAFTPSQIAKLIDPKSLPAFYTIGGLDGLERGLRTDRASSLSSDEEFLNDTISLEEPKATLITGPTAEQPLEPRRKQPEHPPRQRSSDHSFTDRKRVFGENKLPERVPPSFLQLA